MSEGLPRPPRVADGYDAMVARGEIGADAAQVALTAKFDELNARLGEHLLARKSSALGWLFGKRRSASDFVRGIYIHGDVGRGKTMLMDLFYERAAPISKRRVHFQDFMADVHKRVFRMREAIKAGSVASDDPIEPVADRLAEETTLLCLDEFSVTDIADAMILGRLFTRLFSRGLVLVATSNVAPDDLYRGGLNRDHFLPFIALLQERAEVVLLAARTDFRQEKSERAAVYITPLGAAADAAMDVLWQKTARGDGHKATLEILGRELVVPRCADGVARFEFADLCARPLGPSDFLAIAHSFQTVMIDHIPVMDERNRNEAKRFILLIDALYDGHVRLIVSAAAEPDVLYRAERGTEAFEFSRTASRLTEMRSQDYLRLKHRHFIAET